jgi:hypothetical protein
MDKRYKGFNKILYQDDKILKFLIESPKYGNFEVIVDAEDYEKIKMHRWIVHFNIKLKKIVGIQTYLYINKKKATLTLHQSVMNDTWIDHKNGDIFDNRKENLRKCTCSENNKNKCIFINNTSGYKGVSWEKRMDKWLASITVNYKQMNLGYFTDIIEAALAYNEAAIKYHGEFASLNIIKKDNTNE